MNDLDFHNCTRTIFSEIRSRIVLKEEMGPIYNRSGDLSTSTSETLEYWSEYYKNLYSKISSNHNIPDVLTSDSNPTLDIDLTRTEFLDVIYKLRNHKSPGCDCVLNEDFTSALS